MRGRGTQVAVAIALGVIIAQAVVLVTLWQSVDRMGGRTEVLEQQQAEAATSVAEIEGSLAGLRTALFDVTLTEDQSGRVYPSSQGLIGDIKQCLDELGEAVSDLEDTVYYDDDFRSPLSFTFAGC